MARRPFEVGIADLRRSPGTRRRFTGSEPLGGLAISTASVPDGAPIDVDLELEALSDGLVATGTVSAPWEGECRRCLRTVEGRTEVDVREIFQDRPVEGETYPVGAELVDLEPMVRDAVLLALPLAPLCSSDCRGPAPESFPARLEGEPTPDDAADGGDGDRPGPIGDPRWAALAELDFEPEGGAE